jgi:pimeloyl-ACP methyl ester carboxylesterase
MVTSDLAEQTNIALHYAVTCAEDVPRVATEDRARIVGLRARMLAERALAVCDVWPKGTQPKDATLPVESDIPVLLISGALDPVTPPAYAEEAARTLRNSKHIVASGYGHIVSPHACVPRLIAAFIDSAGFADLPASCIEHLTASTRPPLWPDHLAPAR